MDCDHHPNPHRSARLALCALLIASTWAMNACSEEAVGQVPELRLGAAASGQRLSDVHAASQEVSMRVVGMESAEYVAQSAQSVLGDVFEHLIVPSTVTYTVYSGGTLRDVANSFGIYHHEIVELNPEFTLDSQLSKGQRVVVYKRDASGPSASIGSPSRGSLQGGVPMVDGPGRELRKNRFKSWATADTVARLDLAFRLWAKRFPDAHRIWVGNLSMREGGKVKPHKSHQSGRDVDLGYVQPWDGEAQGYAPLQVMDADNLDAGLTWELLFILDEVGELEHAFIDYSVQEILYEHALETGLLTEEELETWIQYPDGKRTDGRVIEHVNGHLDHIHARFACRPTDSECKD